MAFVRKLLGAAAAASVGIAMLGASPASATTTPPFHTVSAGGGSCGINVGLAFDGTNLLVSCYSDGRIDVVKSSDGSLVSTHKPSGLQGPGAMAWDEAHKKLWICNAEDDVGTINTSTWTYTKVFTSNGCFDGLAYDGSDNTIWASPDASSNITHYSVTGTVLKAHTFTGSDLGNTHNSGIAVGGTLLYLANDGGSQIYTSPKDFSSTPTLFATLSTRLEDMECDNVTFASQGKTAMWVIDAYDRTVSAFSIPNGSCGFGGGSTITPQPGCKLTGIANTPIDNGIVLTFLAPTGTYTASIDWGDGQKGNGTVTAKGSGSYQVTGSHTYAAAGQYTISVKVTDANGSSATGTCAATIDPASSVNVEGATTSSTAGELPRTGSSSAPLTITGVLACALGAAALAYSRRRRSMM